jgi:hypothetical protein
MEFDKIVELPIYYFELVGNELLEHEDILIFVNVVQSVYVGAKSAPQLPTVCLLHPKQTFIVGVEILELADVYEIFRFDHGAEELVVGGCVGLSIVKGEIFTLRTVRQLVLESQSFELVVTEPVE